MSTCTVPHDRSIETASGRFFNYVSPQSADVSIEDIATALGQTARFGGHTKRFYSVAEHSVLVYELLAADSVSPELAYAGLLHDAHEAYLGDIPTPLKRMLGEPWERLVTLTDMAIADALESYWTFFRHPRVTEADHLALRYEAAELKLSRGVGPHWDHDEVLEDRAGRVFGFSPGAAAGLFLNTWQRAYRLAAEAGALKGER